MTETPAKYAAAKAPATSSRPVWPCRGMWRVIRTAGIRRGGGLSIACSLLHVRPSLTDAELDWPLRTANCTGFPVVLGFSRPSRCRARIGSASSAPFHPVPRAQRQVQRADRRRVPGNARRATAPPRQGPQGVLGDRSVPSSTRACPLTRRSFPEPSGTSNVGGR